ncbi:MAG: hypothetical protein ACJ780_28055 [Solirubrobacteraceae bacterium]
MSRAVPEEARRLAAELDLQFAHDAELATELADAQRRLQQATIGSGQACIPTASP